MSITIAGITINASQSNVAQVQDAYIAYYARGADVGGLKFWAEKLEIEGGNLDALVNEFGNSAESTALYGGLSSTQLINNIYQQIFGRIADNSGLNFYLDVLKTKSAAFIALDIYNGARNSTDPANTDTALINNKFLVANNFTKHLDLAEEKVAYAGETNAQIARDMLSSVTSTTDAATFDVDTSIALMVNGKPTTQAFTSAVGESLTGLGTFSGIVSNTAGATTLNTSDNASATGTSDILQVTLDSADYNGGATLTGFEQVELRGIAGTPSFLAADLGTTVTQITSKNSTVPISVKDIQSLSTKIRLEDSNSDVTASWDTALLSGDTSVTVELQNANGAANQSVNIANNIETVNLISSTAANVINAIVGKDLSRLNISGDADLKLTGTLGSINTLAADDNSMTGHIVLDAIGKGNHTLSGGSANDHFTFEKDDFDDQDIIDGNGGTGDILSATFTASITNPLQITDIEIFSINTTSNGSFSFDMANVVGMNILQVNANSSSAQNAQVVFNNIDNIISTVVFTGSGKNELQAFDNIKLKVKSSADTNNDSLAVNFNNQGVALTNASNLILSAPEVENFTVSLSDGQSTLKIIDSIALKQVVFSGSTDNDALIIDNANNNTPSAESITLTSSTAKTIEFPVPTANKVTTINLTDSAGADTIKFNSDLSVASDANAADGYIIVNGFDSTNDRLDVASLGLNHGTTGVKFEKAAATGATDNNTTIRVISDNNLLTVPSNPNQPIDVNNAFDALIDLASSTFASNSNFSGGEEVLFAIDGSDNNTYIFYFEAKINSSAVASSADDINLLAVLNGIDSSALSETNFVGF
jgi:hypothetical protein